MKEWIPTRSLKNKVAIVTGASKGIGEAIARALIREEVNVLLVARNEKRLKQLADELGPKASPLAIDLRWTPVIAHQVATEAQYKFKKIDIVINNAASLHPRSSLLENGSDPDHATDGWMLDIVTPMHLIKRLHEDVVERGAVGDVVNISSLAAIMPSPGQGVYAMFKAAMLSLTRTLAVEMRNDCLRVFGVLPGVTDTEMAQPIITDIKLAQKILAGIPTHRWNTPEDLAEAILFLLKAGANGDIVQINGGQMSAVRSF